MLVGSKLTPQITFQKIFPQNATTPLPVNTKENEISALDFFSETNKQNLNIAFKANFKKTKASDGTRCANNTFFFRDTKILNAILDYLNRNNINNGTIVNFGCSDGSETYTLAMLSSIGKPDIPFKFKAYDLSPEIIQDAQNGKYSIFNQKQDFEPVSGWNKDNMDSFLIREEDKLTTEQKLYSTLFRQYFDITETADIIPNSSQDADMIQKEKAKYGDEFDKYWDLKTFQVGNNLKEKCEFNVANINDISTGKLRFPANDKPKVIIFKNAWFHLTGNNLNLDPKDNWKDTQNFINLKKTVKAIYESLDKKGILVTGNLNRDHIFMKNDPIQGKIIATPNPFHEILKEAGFKPLSGSEMPTENNFKNSTIPIVDVPTIWVKE